MAERENLHVIRKEPDLKILKKMYRKEKDGEIVRRIGIIIHMLLLDNVMEVAQLDAISDDSVRRWIKAFNEGGVDALRKKNDPDALEP